MGNADAKQMLYDLVAALPKCWCGEPAQWNTEQDPRVQAGSPFGPTCHHHGHKGYGATKLPHADALQASIHAFTACELRALGWVIRAPRGD